MDYNDNPKANLNYLKDLSPNELKYYIKGYLLACNHMKEAYTKSRIELLNLLLGPEQDLVGEVARSNIKLLDFYEAIIILKEEALHRRFFKETREEPKLS